MATLNLSNIIYLVSVFLREAVLGRLLCCFLLSLSVAAQALALGNEGEREIISCPAVIDGCGRQENSDQCEQDLREKLGIGPITAKLLEHNKLSYTNELDLYEYYEFVEGTVTPSGAQGQAGSLVCKYSRQTPREIKTITFRFEPGFEYQIPNDDYLHHIGRHDKKDNGCWQGERHDLYNFNSIPHPVCALQPAYALLENNFTSINPDIKASLSLKFNFGKTIQLSAGNITQVWDFVNGISIRGYPSSARLYIDNHDITNACRHGDIHEFISSGPALYSISGSTNQHGTRRVQCRVNRKDFNRLGETAFNCDGGGTCTEAETDNSVKKPAKETLLAHCNDLHPENHFKFARCLRDTTPDSNAQQLKQQSRKSVLAHHQSESLGDNVLFRMFTKTLLFHKLLRGLRWLR